VKARHLAFSAPKLVRRSLSEGGPDRADCIPCASRDMSLVAHPLDARLPRACHRQSPARGRRGGDSGRYLLFSRPYWRRRWTVPLSGRRVVTRCDRRQATEDLPSASRLLHATCTNHTLRLRGTALLFYCCPRGSFPPSLRGRHPAYHSCCCRRCCFLSQTRAAGFLPIAVTLVVPVPPSPKTCRLRRGRVVYH